MIEEPGVVASVGVAARGVALRDGGFDPGFDTPFLGVVDAGELPAVAGRFGVAVTDRSFGTLGPFVGVVAVGGIPIGVVSGME